MAHTYVTDRPVLRHLRWWVNSGENFGPENTVPVPASGFVRRLAHTPHYDGGGKDRKEPPASRVQARRSEQAASPGALED